MLHGRRDSRYRTYHYNNIIIRCCMEGEIVDTELITIIILLEKWFPLQGERAHSLNFVVVCMYVNRKEEE